MTERSEFGGAGRDPAGSGLSAHDWDLLADYVGGALDGTPQAAEVERRIAAEPAWEQAHTALAEATTAVRADLSAWGHATPPMPDDVAERLDRALTDAGAVAAADAGAVAAAGAGAVAAAGAGAVAAAGAGAAKVPPRLSERPGRGNLSVVPADPDDQPQRGPRPARSAAARRWRRWATPVAAAAGVLAVVAFGANMLLPQSSTDSTGVSGLNAERGQPASAPDGATQGGAQESPLGDPPIAARVASGTRYRMDTLVDDVRGRVARELRQLGPKVGADAPASPGAGAAKLFSDAGVDPRLRRLVAPGPLRDCLDAVQREHGRAVTSVQLVDYATYEGSPAVVVVFTNQDGANLAWVVGPQCGVRDADARLRATLG